MRFLVSFLFAVVVLTIAGCGGSGPGATGSGATSVPQLTPEEAALWDRASASYSAADGESWGEMYAFTSPQSRETCEKIGYTGRVKNFAELLRRFVDLGDDARLTFRVGEVELSSGASEIEGAVFMEMHSNGRRVENLEIFKFRWVFLEGEWWEEHAAWRDGCVDWKLFSPPQSRQPETDVLLPGWRSF